MAGSVTEIILLIISAFILIFVAVLVSRGAYDVGSLSDYSTNKDLQSARSWLIGATVAAWIGVVLVIILIIAAVYRYSQNSDETSGGTWVKVLLVIVLIDLILIGILAAVSASYLNTAKDSSSAATLDTAIFGTQGTGSALSDIIFYTEAAAALAIIGAVIVLIGLIVVWYSSRSSTTEDTVSITATKTIANKKVTQAQLVAFQEQQLQSGDLQSAEQWKQFVLKNPAAAMTILS